MPSGVSFRREARVCTKETSWAGEIPVWPVALLLVIAAAAALLFRGNQRSSSGLWVAIGLTAIAFVFFHLWPSSTGTTRRGWWRDSSHRIAAALRAVGDEVAGLEEVSVEIAERVRTFMAGSNADALRAGMRIENQYLVTASGVEHLTPFPVGLTD